MSPTFKKATIELIKALDPKKETRIHALKKVDFSPTLKGVQEACLAIVETCLNPKVRTPANKIRIENFSQKILEPVLHKTPSKRSSKRS